MKGAGSFFSNFMNKSKQILNESKNIVVEATSKLTDEFNNLTQKDSNGVGDDEMLLHLNLVHDGTSQFKEYEQNLFQYFLNNLTNEEIKHNEEVEEEVKSLSSSQSTNAVDYLFVIGFDHKIGSVIEYFYPEPDEKIIDENTKKALSFIGLPDGSHSVLSDYSFFIVPDANGKLYYGVSCFRQIRSSELTEKDDKISRSFVQKSVCALSRIPIFATLMIKLLPTTHAYFKQKNFKDTKILEEFYGSVNKPGASTIKYSDLFTGFDLKRIVIYLKQNILTLLKLLLLEGKIVVYSQKASKVCTFVLSLFSLLPGASHFNYDNGKEIQNVISHYGAYGLPLKLFNNRCIFLPLSTLNDLDLLSECKGLLIGCTNKLFMQYPTIKLDCIINLDDNEFDFKQTELCKLAKSHTSMEKHFINSLIKQLKEIATDLTPEQMYFWDSTDQDNMPDIESLDHADLCAKNGINSYIKQLLCRLSFAEICAREQETPSSSKPKEIKFQMVRTELNEERELGLSKTKDTTNSIISDEEAKDVKLHNSKVQAHHTAVTKTTLKDYTDILSLLREYDLKFLSHWTRTYNYQKWKSEHHSKCAFFDSGIVGHEIQEFYKEREVQETNEWIVYENGDKYNGTLLGGKKHGKGVFQENHSNLTYNGEFYGDERHGNGVLSSNNNDYIYDGQWVRGVKHGAGKLTTKEFEYEGHFKHNEFHGSGIYTDKNGNVFDGEWSRGKRNGIFHLTKADGSKFIGEFKEDKIHGNGQWNYSNGQIFSGEYSNGVISGHGLKCYNVEKGIKYEGMWRLDKPGGGVGVYTNENGEMISGIWEQGRLIPNDLVQPEFTTKDGTKIQWSSLDEVFQRQMLDINL